jgi:hypothetical protein
VRTKAEIAKKKLKKCKFEIIKMSTVTKQAIIQKTVQALQLLPQDKAQEISDFADFMLKKYEDVTLQQGIQTMQSQSEAFNFLNEEEELYSPTDIKEKF